MSNRSKRARKGSKSKDYSALVSTSAERGRVGEKELGRQWSLGEVTRFLELFAEHGTKWAKVSNQLTNRTPIMCEALYNCNKGMIRQNVNAQILHTAMADRYSSSPSLSWRASSSATGSRKVRKVRPAVPQTKPKRRLEFEGNRSSGYDDGDDDDDDDDMDNDNDDDDDDDDDDDEDLEEGEGGPGSALPFKKRLAGEGSSAGSPAPKKKSARRSMAFNNSHMGAAPLTAELKAQDRKLDHFLHGFEGARGELFCLYEWFYSHVDRDYFTVNEFGTMLASHIGVPLGTTPLLTRSEWAVVRRRLGRPRRMSPAFFASERAKLEAFREDVRLVRSGNAVRHPEKHGLNLFSVREQLAVGSKVAVWMWQNMTVQSATVTEVAEDQYQVSFDSDESGRLVWVSDLDVMPHRSEEGSRILADHRPFDIGQGLSPLLQGLSASPARGGGAGGVAGGPDSVAGLGGVRHYSAAEIQLLAQLARVNRMKRAVLDALDVFHQFAEKAALNCEPLSHSFKLAYAELFVHLQTVNRLTAPILRDMPKNNFETLQLESADVSLPHLAHNWLRRLAEKSEADAATVVQDNARSVDVEDPERKLVTNSVSLIQYIQNVAAKHDLFMPSELNVALDKALTKLRPVHSENLEAFRDVEQLVGQVLKFLADDLDEATARME